VTLPSGAVIVTAQWALVTPDGVQGAADCGMEVRPAGRLPQEGVLVAGCELYDPRQGQPVGNVLLIAAPPSVAVVRIYGADSAFLAEHAMPDGGVLLVPRPEGQIHEVEAVTDGGVLLGRTEPLGHWTPTG
jgi:hypothetical protein